MTFEKAVELANEGYWLKRPCGTVLRGKGIEFKAGNITFKIPVDSNFVHLDLNHDDITSNDWKIECFERKIRNDAFVNMPFTPNKYFDEYAKQVKEESAMYETIEITFKSGDTITYNKDEWDDYSYDGKSVCVKKDGAWVGIYNFDHVFSVELKA